MGYMLILQVVVVVEELMELSQRAMVLKVVGVGILRFKVWRISKPGGKNRMRFMPRVQEGLRVMVAQQLLVMVALVAVPV